MPADTPRMGVVDDRLIGHWERVRTERDEERRFLTQILRERARDSISLPAIADELERFRGRLEGQRAAAETRLPNLGDFD